MLGRTSPGGARRAAVRTARRAALSAAALVLVVCLGGAGPHPQACAQTAERALDVVHLRNGRSLEGKITEETRKHVTLEYGGGLLRIERADIVTIEKDRPVAGWELEMRERVRRQVEELAKAVLAEIEERQAAAAGAGGAEEELSEEERKEIERLKRLVEDMASPDDGTRQLARRLLEGEGRKAVPVLTEALFHRSTFARTAAAQMLGDLRARESVRDMIVALRSAVPDSVKVRHWQRGFVRALRDSLRGITGQNFGLNPRGAGEDEAVAKWVAWWDGKPPEGQAREDEPGAVPRGAYAEWDTPQRGEEDLDKEDPEYARKLWEARKVGDTRHSYPPPADRGAGAGR